MTRGHLWALGLFAARWIYSFVPYDDWTDALLGVRLSDVFGWQRNHFDRLVHFAYGLCLTMMLRLKPLRSWEVMLALLGAVVAAAVLARQRRGRPVPDPYVPVGDPDSPGGHRMAG